MKINITQKKIIEIVVHIVAWSIFLSLPTFFKPAHPGDNHTSIIEDLVFTPRLQNSILLIVIFYFNYYVVIPKFYLKKKYVAMLISFLASFGALLLVSEIMRPAEFNQGKMTFSKFMGPSHNLFMFINVYAFSFALGLYRQWQKVRMEQLNTEVSFLKAQINPHFLFNTLNSIYSLTITKSDKAPDAVVKLSSLMRYSVTDADKDKVALSKELDYIKDYIALQRLRLTHKVKVSLDVAGDMTGKMIVPFILTPFIENAFKHGVNSEESCAISIVIKIHGNTLEMIVSNLKVYVEKDEYSVSGLGISSTRKRLAYRYPGVHQLLIDNGDDDFTVNLKIKLQ